MVGCSDRFNRKTRTVQRPHRSRRAHAIEAIWFAYCFRHQREVSAASRCRKDGSGYCYCFQTSI